MSSLTDPEVSQLLNEPNHAVVSTLNEDGSILSTVVWIDVDDGLPAVNSAVGRRWPTNLERDPHVTVVVYEQGNPYNFVEIRGTAEGRTEGADGHIDRLAKKYMGPTNTPTGGPTSSALPSRSRRRPFATSARADRAHGRGGPSRPRRSARRCVRP